jgi:hypothetical protein
MRLGDYEVEKDSPHGLLLRGGGLEWPYRMPLGAIVAVAELIDCLPIVDKPREDVPAYVWPVPAEPDVHDDHLWLRYTKGTPVQYRCDELGDQLPYGDFTPGRWAWILGRVKRVPRAIPCTGHQGLWDVARAGAEVLTRVTDLVERAAA